MSSRTASNDSAGHREASVGTVDTIGGAGSGIAGSCDPRSPLPDSGG